MIDAWLSDGEVALVDASGAFWRHEAGSMAGALEALGAHLRAAPAGRVRVWLGAALCRPVRIAPVAGELSRTERVRLAEQAAIEQSGLTPPCRVTIDGTDAAHEAIAIVVEESVLAAIERVLGAAGRRARTVQPWWAHLLAAALRERPTLRALGVFEGGAMTILVGEGQRFSSAHALCPVADSEAASAAFARTTISAMIPQDDALSIRLDWTAEGAPAFGARDVAFGPWALKQGATS